MVYYLGLSLLSNNPAHHHKRAERRNFLSAEAKRILSLYEDKPIAEEDIAREASGRPFFPGCDTDFSVSHSGALAAVSLVRGKNMHTGCDVELVRPRTQAKKIAEDFFTLPERKYIESHGSFDGTRFYEIWTLKECFLKLRGLSVFDMAGTPSFINSEGQYQFAFDGMVYSTEPQFGEGSPLDANFGQVSFSLYELTGSAGERYVLAAALKGTEQYYPKITWFSQGFLACKNIANINAATSPAETVRPKI